LSAEQSDSGAIHEDIHSAKLALDFASDALNLGFLFEITHLGKASTVLSFDLLYDLV
jgi:hypothetical protein